LIDGGKPLDIAQGATYSTFPLKRLGWGGAPALPRI
jgi:hypothetical protein